MKTEKEMKEEIIDLIATNNRLVDEEKAYGYSENNNAPHIVADVGSAPLHSIVACPLSIYSKAKLNKK